MVRAVSLLILFFTEASLGFFIEQIHQFRFARLSQCLLLFIFLAFLIKNVRGPARDWLLGGTSFIAGLIIIEGVALALEKPQPVTTDSGMARDRAVVGWGAAAPGVYHLEKTAADGHVIYDVYATIDDSLIRHTSSAGNSNAIAFFGDSVTFGEGLSDGDTLPQYFAALTRGPVPVFNLSYSGWSPAQNLAALQANLYRSFLKQPQRFVLMTSSWHVARTACKAGFSMRAPHYELVGDQLRLEGKCAGTLAIAWHGFANAFALYRVFVTPTLTALTRRDVETYLKIVETFVKIAERDYGAQTTILFLPFGDAYLESSGFTETQIITAFRKTGADVLVDSLPPIADPKLYVIQGDGHPTGLANKARAKELEAHLEAVAGAPVPAKNARSAN